MKVDKINVYLEVGSKRTFAGAVEWPGWCRVGRSEADALQALFDQAPRYMQVIERAGMSIPELTDVSSFEVIERLAGNATTDFGAPDLPPSADSEPVNEAELLRLQNLLKACWQAFDRAAQVAAGKELSRGPRGGGRDLDGIIDHVLGSAEGYLGRLAWKLPKSEIVDLQARLRTNPCGGAGCPRPRRAWGCGGARPARRKALDSPLLCPPFSLAYPRPCLGDRRPDHREIEFSPNH